VQLLCHLFVHRWGDLWLESCHSSWLSDCIKSLSSLGSIPARTNEDRSTVLASISIHTSIYRHLLVLEKTCRPLFTFIPKEILNSRHLACDPLPPYLKVNEYNAEFFQGVEDVLGYRPRRLNVREEERFLERLIPDGVFRRQFQVCLPHANPSEINGVVGFFCGTPQLCRAISRRHCSVCAVGSTVA
jgi:hypothetical protein